MRHMMPDLREYSLEESTVCEVRNLGQKGNEKLVAYQLCAAPKLVAVKQFLSDEEVDQFLAMEAKPLAAHPATFAGATETLRLLDFEETELVKDVEARLVATGGLPLSHLAPLGAYS